MPKKAQTIYEYFKDYPKEKVDEMITKLTDEEKELVKLRYGDDLDRPVEGFLTGEQSKIFYGKTLQIMKRILKNPNYVRKAENSNRKKKNTDNYNSNIKEEIETEIEVNNVIEHDEPVKKEESINPPILDEKKTNDSYQVSFSKEDYENILSLLRSPSFNEISNKLGTKEAVIISLRLGYIDGKYFNTKDIANFLEISEDEVIETTKKILLLYKDDLNNFLDDIINKVTDDTENNLSKSFKYNIKYLC